LKVLSEPSRLKIVLALSKGEMCVYHIVEAVNSNQSAVSHQLRILKDNNIVKSKRDGQSIVYSLIDEHIMQIISLVKIHVEE
jgi:ArsR family transcriptional regulator